MADLLYPFTENPDVDINEYGVGTVTRGFGDVIVDRDPALIPNINSVCDLTYTLSKIAADANADADTDTEPGPEEGDDGDGDTGDTGDDGDGNDGDGNDGDEGGDTEPDDEQP